MSGPFGSSQWMYNASSGLYGFEISNSLRFNDGSSDDLNFTPSSAGNRKTMTWSGWVKRSVLSGHQRFFGSGVDNYLSFTATGGIEINLRSGGSTSNAFIVTNRLHRDVSAWYHIVMAIDTTQGTDTNRVKVYVNGVQQTSFVEDAYPSQNNDLNSFNNTVAQYIGRYNPGNYYDGYMADVNFIDGLALTPASFGELKNDIWIPKDTSGLTFGTNGYRLQFKQTGTSQNSSGIGADTSGSDNHFAVANLTAVDVVPDSPTNNFATLNGVMRANMTFSEGNLKALGVGNNYDNISGTIAFDPTDSRGYYWEWYVVAHDDDTEIGIAKSDNVNFNQSDASNPTAHSSDTPSYRGNGQKKVANSNSSYGTAWDNGNILSVAVKSGSVFFYHNGTLQASGTAATTGLTGMWVPSFSINGTQSGIVNFGQDSSFGGNVTAQGNADANGKGDFYYAPPSGYLALCTANLPDPVATIDPAKGGSPQDYFNTIIWSGASDTAARDFSGVGFQPDLVWAKVRSAAGNHTIFDSVRGAGADKELDSSDGGAEGDADTALYGYIDEFLADGFSSAAGSSSGNNNLYFNDASETFVAWNWKAGTAFSNDASATSVGTIDSEGSVNTDVGFSIIKYGGTGSNGTVAHGLNSAPDVVLVKGRANSSRFWTYWGTQFDASTTYIYLNTTDAEDTGGASITNSAYPTSSVFSIGTSVFVNGSGETYIAYCFHEVEGYSKFGKYTGNSNANGPFIYTGFRPAWLLIKKTSATDDWAIHDNKRVDSGTNSNPIDDYLKPNTSGSEGDDGASVDFLSNGFKWRLNSGMRNQSGQTYIYMAFAEQPFKYANAR